MVFSGGRLSGEDTVEPARVASRERVGFGAGGAPASGECRNCGVGVGGTICGVVGRELGIGGGNW